ncbi:MULTISPECIES: ion transporter [Euryhalocaulis]|uniref:ion transporter n=1 Tax=Euryhalocaulis TaxID=1712422 RepID=UPI00039DC70F|nr:MULTISPECIES: ion transporter [Euryhalocaulis]MBA4802425.1 ion transporter [Euryhalocaulis sp.]
MDSFRARLWEIIDPEEGEMSWFNWLIVILIFASLVMLALETETSLRDGFRGLLLSVNFLILLVFAGEFALRLWAAGVDERWRGVKGHIDYVARPHVIADFLAFGPELSVILFFPNLAEQLMFLRALRLLRLLRLASFFPVFRRIGRALADAAPQLGAAAMIAFGAIFISACILYFAESKIQPEAFGSIPRALWWAVATLTTVGYGDVYPVTLFGRVAAGMAAVTGVGLVALPAGILATTFDREFSRPPPDSPDPDHDEDEDEASAAP